jgi:hypothetical protein
MFRLAILHIKMHKPLGVLLGGGGMLSLVLLVWRWVMALVPGSGMTYGGEIVL